MWPCLCNFTVKSCDPGSTNHPQQSPSHLPNNSVATGCKLFFWMNKRSSSDNWPKPWFRSRPKMSQWESTALANNCCNKSLVRPSFWLATVLFKWADPTTRFCKGTFKSNLPNIPLRAHCPDCKLSFTAWTNCPLRDCAPGARPARGPKHFFAVNEPSAVPWWWCDLIWCHEVACGVRWSNVVGCEVTWSGLLWLVLVVGCWWLGVGCWFLVLVSCCRLLC